MFLPLMCAWCLVEGSTSQCSGCWASATTHHPEISSALLCDAVKVCKQWCQYHKNSFPMEMLSAWQWEYWPLTDVMGIPEYYRASPFHCRPGLTRCFGAVGRREKEVVTGDYTIKRRWAGFLGLTVTIITFSLLILYVKWKDDMYRYLDPYTSILFSLSIYRKA